MLNHRQSREKVFSDISIYPVITTEFCRNSNAVKTADAILKGGARCLQLREKHLPDKEYFELALEMRNLTDQYNALLIIDDRIDIALGVNADGVHLGQDDFPVSVARILGPELIIGTSTHNPEEIKLALAKDISYLNIGPIYSTQTKETGFNPLGTRYLESVIPDVPKIFTVMGGIKLEHFPELKKAGVKIAAMVTALTDNDNPEAAMRLYLNKWCN
ncbi:thiamine phosphate synthase [Myxococcota bacterium]|nr:thiamine phosphate synthase [Myxococcota bacterium]MBU1379940.1 thiamine phosphate synthase [Myxococcota bacterium]MBU1497066.1 thiamine phosphate synthase [Myxococcota bacterium]